jgi:riboflavin kinase/FMN adenylyltransferase
MRIYRHHDNLETTARDAVVAVGNFDGVHQGHRAVIGAAARLAAEAEKPLGILTFEPHPRSYFRPDDPPFRLTPFRPKMRQLEAQGVDLVYCLTFDADLAALTAERFVAEILFQGLGVAHVVVGYDFVFGKGRGGNTDFLRAVGPVHGIGVSSVDVVARGDGAPVSSTLIRELLRAGRPAEAALALGRAWEVEGHVLPGDRRGRQLGFPTANLDLEGYLLPRFGVYAVRAAVDAGEAGHPPRWIDGVANLGLRPTIGDGKILLEAHLFDFQGDLYGKLMRIQLVDFLRPEARFDGLDALRAQIDLDCRRAREILAGGAGSALTAAPAAAERKADSPSSRR